MNEKLHEYHKMNCSICYEIVFFFELTHFSYISVRFQGVWKCDTGLKWVNLVLKRKTYVPFIIKLSEERIKFSFGVNGWPKLKEQAEK